MRYVRVHYKHRAWCRWNQRYLFMPVVPEIGSYIGGCEAYPTTNRYKVWKVDWHWTGTRMVPKVWTVEVPRLRAKAKRFWRRGK